MFVEILDKLLDWWWYLVRSVVRVSESNLTLIVVVIDLPRPSVSSPSYQFPVFNVSRAGCPEKVLQLLIIIIPSPGLDRMTGHYQPGFWFSIWHLAWIHPGPTIVSGGNENRPSPSLVTLYIHNSMLLVLLLRYLTFSWTYWSLSSVDLEVLLQIGQI